MSKTDEEKVPWWKSICCAFCSRGQYMWGYCHCHCHKPINWGGVAVTADRDASASEKDVR